ncbi:endonuclease domain-containing protein [Leisingera caerulea]|nr:endonuclease domain-containing protein [Leisingera caerulea]
MVPEVVRVSLMPVSGIQPLTGEMFKIAGGVLETAPSEAEFKLFQEAGTQFQMIHLVLSLAWWEDSGGEITAVPFSISAVPSSKRGKVTQNGIEFVAALNGAPVEPSSDTAYVGFDPFQGEHSLFSTGGGVAFDFTAGKSPIDELGIVIERYFLALDYNRDDVAEFDEFLPDDQSKKAYLRNRIKKLYTPFKAVECRRIWGLETPIELFLFQELLSRGLRPQCQCIIYPDGCVYQSLYDVYTDVEFRRGQNILTEADMYLPDKRLAIFCDGAHHERAKQQKKDAKIGKQLANLGIQSVRVPGRLINSDLEAAGDLVSKAIAG